jgi:hypothetical protein
MAHFTKTVSQLTRDELLSAADNFDLAQTGNVTTLCKRVKTHIDANEHYMDNPRYVRLFSPQQQARYAAHSASPTPPPWGGIGAGTPDSDNSSSESGDSGDENDIPGHTLSTDLNAERDPQIKHLPPAALTKAIGLLFSNGESFIYLHSLSALFLFLGLNPFHTSQSHEFPLCVIHNSREPYFIHDSQVSACVRHDSREHYSIHNSGELLLHPFTILESCALFTIASSCSMSVTIHQSSALSFSRPHTISRSLY